jgi:hypothetical protein
VSPGNSKVAAVKSQPVTIITPDYWEDACKHLSKKDRVMKRLIPQFGDACLESRGDAFTTLARSIVGQQISVKAAQSVWDRFAVLPRRLTPGNVLKLKVDDMRAAGLSARKVEYLVDLALHFDNGTVHVGAWQDMDRRDVPHVPPDAAQRAAAGRCGPDQRHQPQLFLGRSGQPQRCPRSGRGLGAFLQRGNLVYLAIARTGAGRILTTGEDVGETNLPRL